MKIFRLASAAALAALWFSAPLASFAQDEGTYVDEGDRDDRGDRDRDDRDDRGDRDRGDRDGRRGPRGPRGGERREMDPELRTKLDKIRELEMKAHDLALNLRKGTDAENASAKSELRKTIGELFDAKMTLETAILARMERQVAEMKTKLAKRKTSREKAIESRFVRMSGEGDEWD